MKDSKIKYNQFKERLKSLDMPDLFSQPADIEKMSRELRDEGIKTAVDHANAVSPGWSEKAYKFLVDKYLPQCNKAFMTEEVREFAAYWDVDPPPDERAWGAVIVKAVKAGIIKRVGYSTVKNPRGHMHPCALWVAVKPSEKKT